MQAVRIRILRRVHSVTLCDKTRSCENNKPLNVESPLLQIERSQVRLIGHVSRMSQEKLARQVLLSTPMGKRPEDRTSTRWRYYISNFAWSRIGMDPAELSEIVVDCEVFRALLRLLPPPPSLEKKRVRNWRNERMSLSKSNINRIALNLYFKSIALILTFEADFLCGWFKL